MQVSQIRSRLADVALVIIAATVSPSGFLVIGILCWLTLFAGDILQVYWLANAAGSFAATELIVCAVRFRIRARGHDEISTLGIKLALTAVPLVRRAFRRPLGVTLRVRGKHIPCEIGRARERDHDGCKVWAVRPRGDCVAEPGDRLEIKALYVPPHAILGVEITERRRYHAN